MPTRLRRRPLPLTATLLLTSSACLGAQQAPHIVVVGPIAHYGALVGGFTEGLKSAGISDPRIRIDVRNSDSAAEATAALGPEVNTGLNAIVTIFGQSTKAASMATTKIPIVFCPVADPVASKFAASNEAPGGNLTGIASADAEASRRRLAAFRKVLPKLKRLAVLFDSGFPPDQAQMKHLEEIAPSAGLALVSRPTDDEKAAVAALRALGPGDADAILILKDQLLRSASENLKRTAMDQKLPILVGDSDLVEFPGVLAAVGPNQRALGRACGRMTARILKDAKPARLPIEHPAFELLVNLKTADHLGVHVPAQAIKQAVRVIR